MKSIFNKLIFFSFLLIIAISCSSKKQKDTVKYLPNDPFKSTIAASQFFDIDTKEDNVLEGENGTIIICPKGCFLNKNGEIVSDKVKIELSEALILDNMLQSNLTTTSNGKLLETDGMIYFNVTKDSEQLKVNPKNSIRIEIPTTDKKAGMKVYKGIRDENGKMNWVSPIEIDNSIRNVDINDLDFLPKGFQSEVEKGMPFRKYKVATKGLVDSLYYSFSFGSGSELILKGLVSSDYYSEYIDKNSNSLTGVYYDLHNSVAEIDTFISSPNYGIDPAIIKVINSDKYQNTLIATKEFETRLQLIFKTCDNALLELYIKNIDKNLYEIDELAAKHLKDKPYYQDFYNFAQQRLTKVKNADKYALLLKGYYEKQLKKVKEELGKERDKVIKELEKKNKKAEKFAQQYEKLLWKRERYRMETYGFNWTGTGWINIDKGTQPKDWDNYPLEVEVKNGKQFDKVHTYVIYTSIKSLYSLNTTDNEQFYVGNEQEKKMLMPIKKTAVIVAIGYKNDVPSMAVREFETVTEQKVSVTLEPTDAGKIKLALQPYEKYATENRISKDLVFMKEFYEEKKRQIELNKERAFIGSLWWIVYPCSLMSK